MGKRLKDQPKIKPLDPGKPLAPYHVPAPPAAKFKDIPGQLSLEDMGVIETGESGHTG